MIFTNQDIYDCLPNFQPGDFVYFKEKSNGGEERMCYRIIEKIVFYNPEEHSSIGCQDRALFDQDFYVAILINADSDGNIIPSYFRGDLPIEKLIKVRTI